MTVATEIHRPMRPPFLLRDALAYPREWRSQPSRWEEPLEQFTCLQTSPSASCRGGVGCHDGARTRARVYRKQAGGSVKGEDSSVLALSRAGGRRTLELEPHGQA